MSDTLYLAAQKAMLLHKQDDTRSWSFRSTDQRRQCLCLSLTVSTTRASDMRQRVRAASCLAFVLLCHFPNVQACGDPSVQPVSGDATVHERVFELDAQGRVIGGTIARAHSWPWMVLLNYESNKDGKKYMCGATIISEQWLMTAAHCAIDMNVANTQAYVGIQSIQGISPSTVRSVQSKIVHPNYDVNRYFNDIALLKLTSKLSFDSNLQPICLPWPKNDSSLTQTGTYAYATGWGQYTNNGVVQKGSSLDLRQVQLPFIDSEVCRREWPINGNQVCAGAYMRGTGQGDSGGPLKVKGSGSDQRWYQVGITSYGSNDPDNGLIDQGTYPGKIYVLGSQKFIESVYTRVSQYCKFIHDETNGDVTCSSFGLSISLFLIFSCSIIVHLF